MQAIIAVALVAAVAASLTLLLQDEPRSHGRSLSSWLGVCRKNSGKPDSPDLKEAETAIRAMGTNTIPCLLTWIRIDRVPPKIILSLAPSDRGRFYRTASKLFTPTPDLKRAEDAVNAFRILGPLAAPAIPDLVALAKRSGPTGLQALDALAAIGQPALPAVLDLTTNQEIFLEFSAVLTLAKFGTNAAPAVPTLISFLESPPGPTDRSMAATITLGRLRLESGAVMSALYTAAKGEPPLRDEALSALAEYGPQGRATLQRLLENADPQLAGKIRDFLHERQTRATAANEPVNRGSGDSAGH